MKNNFNFKTLKELNGQNFTIWMVFLSKEPLRCCGMVPPFFFHSLSRSLFFLIFVPNDGSGMVQGPQGTPKLRWPYAFMSLVWFGSVQYELWTCLVSTGPIMGLILVWFQTRPGSCLARNVNNPKSPLSLWMEYAWNCGHFFPLIYWIVS